VADLDLDWTVELMNPINFPAFFGESRRIIALSSAAIVFASLVVIAYLTGGLLSALLGSVVLALVVRLLWAAATFRPMHCDCPPHPENPCCRSQGHGPHGVNGCERGRHDNGGYGFPHHEGPHPEGPRHDGPRHEDFRNDGPRNDGPRNGEPRNDGPRNGEPRNDGPRTGGQRNDGARSDGDRSRNGGDSRRSDTPRGDRPRPDGNRSGEGRGEPGTQPASGVRGPVDPSVPRPESPVIDPWRGGFPA
jgi:hypothetical protein